MNTAAKRDRGKISGARWVSRGAIALLLAVGVSVNASEEGVREKGDRATTAALQQARAKLKQFQSIVPLYVAGKCRVERGSGERAECRVAFIRSKDGWAAFYADELDTTPLAKIAAFVPAQPNREAEIWVRDVGNIGYRELAVLQPMKEDEMVLRPAVYWRGGLPFGDDFTLFDFCHVVVPVSWLRASVLPAETAKQVVWNVGEEADGTVKCELTGLPSKDGPPTTRSLGWKRFRDGICVEWARPGWSESRCRDFVGEYGRVEGPFDPATSFPRTLQVAFMPERGGCDALTTVTVELDRPRVRNIGRAIQATDPAMLRREGWASIEPAELYWKFRLWMRALLGARRETLWSAAWPFPVENERPLGTLTVRLSGPEVQKQKLGVLTGGQFWGILEVVNDRDVPTTITTLFREIWLYGTVYSVLPDQWIPVRLEEGQYFRTVIHLEPHKVQGPDIFYIYVGCDDGKNGGERSYTLQASCEVVPPVAVQGVTKERRRQKASCGRGLGLTVHVAPDVKGEPQLAVIAPECLEPRLHLKGKLEPGKSTRLEVPMCWEMPPEREAERVWIRIIGYDDTLQPGSGWVVTEPEGSNSYDITQPSPATVILPSP